MTPKGQERLVMAKQTATAPVKKNGKPAPAVTTNVTTEEADKKKGAKKRPVYPIPEGQKLKEVPGDFDFDKHARLKRGDFEQDHIFFTYRADEMDFRAAAMRKQAEEAKLLGSSKDRAQLKRVKNLAGKMTEMADLLTSQGIDVKELLAAQGIDLEAIQAAQVKNKTETK